MAAVSLPLEAASNVAVSSPTDGQSLTWDATNQRWVNTTVSGGSGVTIEEVDDHIAEAVNAGVGIIVAHSDEADTHTISRREALVADTDGSTVTLNLASGEHHSLTLGGNRTLAISNAVVGQKFRLVLNQDATGGRTVTWFSGVTWANGYAPTLTTVPDSGDVFEFICSSTGNGGSTATFVGWILTTERSVLAEVSATPDGESGSVEIVETTPGSEGTVEGLIELWDFNESGSATDFEGQLTAVKFATGGDDVTTGVDGGNAVDWSTSETLTSGAGAAAITPGASVERSITAWLKHEDADSALSVAWVFGAHSVTLAHVNVSGGSRYRVTVVNSGGTASHTSDTDLISNTWHFVAVRWKINELGLRSVGVSVDGGSFDETSAAPSSTFSTTAATVTLTGLSGATDQVGLWSRALTNADVAEHYNSGSGLFYPYSGSGTSEVQTLTVTGSSGTYDLTYGGDTVTLNATDNAATIQTALRTIAGFGSVTVTGTGPFTITFPASLGDIELLTVDDSGMTSAGTGDVDWSICERVAVTLTAGDGVYTLTNTNVVAGKSLHVTIANDGATGSLAWGGVSVSWGTVGAPAMPADTESIEVVLFAKSSSSIIGRLFRDAMSDDAFEPENKSGETLQGGTVVATHSSGTGVIKAVATASGTLAVGLLTSTTANAVSGTVQTSGPFTLSDWSDVIGSETLATRGKYYLSTTAGQLTTTPSSTVGNYVQFVGVALSPTTLDLDPGDGIKL